MPTPWCTTCAAGGSINRYYDPTTGQFITVDPLVGQTMVPYVYGASNSVNENDPTGDLAQTSTYCSPPINLLDTEPVA